MSTLHLNGSSLLSKWGFGDGDIVSDWWWDEYDQPLPEGVDEHDALRLLVQTYLVPAIEAAGHTVEIVEIGTIHNPIRAHKVDGEEITLTRLDDARLEEIDVELAADVVLHAVTSLTA